MTDVFSATKHTIKRIKVEDSNRVGNGLDPQYTTKQSYDTLFSKIIDGYSPLYSASLREIYLSTGKIGCKGDITDEVFGVISGLTNWIEDRRIDNFVFNSAPGYRYNGAYRHT